MPPAVGGIPIPQDGVSRATWSWAQRALPRYLLGHSVRTFCWGVTLAGREGWAFDPQILWTASLLHDGALRHLPRNTMCFEIEGAEFARRFLERNGLAAGAAERVEIAIILHMRSGVTLDDGVESVLLDRATGLDVRGDGYPLVDPGGARRAATVRVLAQRIEAVAGEPEPAEGLGVGATGQADGDDDRVRVGATHGLRDGGEPRTVQGRRDRRLQRQELVRDVRADQLGQRPQLRGVARGSALSSAA